MLPKLHAGGAFSSKVEFSFFATFSDGRKGVASPKPLFPRSPRTGFSGPTAPVLTTHMIGSVTHVAHIHDVEPSGPGPEDPRVDQLFERDGPAHTPRALFPWGFLARGAAGLLRAAEGGVRARVHCARTAETRQGEKGAEW